MVDNGSGDGTGAMLAEPAFQPPEFPAIRFIENPTNAGYTRPMNQALQQARGDVLVQLNPDTLLLPGALDKLLAFLQEHPQAGICGPKVLNADRSLQKSCRRGEPTPWAVLTYFLGLSRLFPKSRLFGQYLLNYMDEDQTHPVAGLAGSCMMIRRAVVEQIGYLDEQFFAYQEDTDYCYRARQAGWQVFYMPRAQIIHYGGMGGSRCPALSLDHRMAPFLFQILPEKPGEELFFSFQLVLLRCHAGKAWAVSVTQSLPHREISRPKEAITPSRMTG